MPKVLRIINRFNLGGPTYNAAYLTKGLPSEYETMLIGGQKEEHEDSSTFILDNLGVKYTIIEEMKRAPKLLDDIKAYRKIKGIIKEFQPDIVHTHAAKAGFLGRLAASRCKVPVIIHTYHGHVFHSYFGRVKTSIFKGLERWMAKKSTKIIAISELQKNEISIDHKIAPSEKFHVIPLGFDLRRFQENYEQKRFDFRNKYRLEDETIAVGIVGRLAPVKNHTLFLDAIKMLNTNGITGCKYFIIGDGETKVYLMTYCEAIGLSYSSIENEDLSHNIIFTSWIKEIDWAYAGIDITCLCSKNEGTPVSLIESQAAGTPIVSTRVGGIENIVIEGETALLCENNSASDLYEKLKFLITNPEKRKQMAMNGSNYVNERFSNTRLCNDMTNLYGELIEYVHP